MAQDWITIAAPGGWRAEINPQGAELSRLQARDGSDLLWDGDPAFWTGRAPILFPIVGALNGNSYRYRGETYPLAKHGFARHSRFDILDAGDDRVLLRLAASETTREIYPFGFQLDLTFTVAGDALTLSASVANLGKQDMPFSFGFHPALRWPLDPGGERDNARILFDLPEPEPVQRIDAAGLIARSEPSPVEDRCLALRDALFTDDALIFAPAASRGVTYGAHPDGVAGRQLRVEFPRFPDLGIWTKPGAGYICIEPWQGHADPAGFTGDIFAKPGVLRLQPGDSWQAAMVISEA
jgi:galactose mutarotase-like enzyme